METAPTTRMAPLRFLTEDWPRGPITLLALVVYLLLPTRLYFWDGIAFANNIEAPNASAISLLHPNHLVYNLIAYAVWKGLSAVGIALRALPVLQALNAFFAAATVYLLWQILKETTQSPAYSTWGSLLFAFSATWWKYATDADAYILSILLLVLTYRMLSMPRIHPFAAGLTHGAAILVHQLALFFLPVAMLSLLYGCKRTPGNRRGVFALAAYAITGGSITVATYVSAFLLWSQSPANVLGFWNWITTHQDDVPFFSFNFLRNTQLTLRAIVRLLFGGKFSLFHADVVTITIGLAFCVTVGLVIRSFGRPHRVSSLRNVARRSVSWLEMSRLPLVWLSCYVVFLFFGRPQDTFHWLFCCPALILLIAATGIYISDSSKWMVLLFAVMFVCNFVFYIYPYCRSENNQILAFALDHRKEWTPGSVIVCSQFHSDLWTISYFNPQASWVAMPVTTIAEVNRRRSDAVRNGQSMWLEATAYSAMAGLPGGPEWLENNIDHDRSLIKETSRNRLLFYRLR